MLKNLSSGLKDVSPRYSSEVSFSLCSQAGHVDDSGRSVLVLAAQHGHLEVLRFLLKCADWSCTACCSQRGVSRSQAVQQALIAAASMGHTEVRKAARTRNNATNIHMWVLKSGVCSFVDGVILVGSS